MTYTVRVSHHVVGVCDCVRPACGASSVLALGVGLETRPASATCLRFHLVDNLARRDAATEPSDSDDLPQQ